MVASLKLVVQQIQPCDASEHFGQALYKGWELTDQQVLAVEATENEALDNNFGSLTFELACGEFADTVSRHSTESVEQSFQLVQDVL